MRSAVCLALAHNTEDTGREMFSSHSVIDSPKNTSVEYKNLYIINGQITYLAKSKIDIPNSNRFLNCDPWKPVVRISTKESADSIALSIRRKIPLCIVGGNWWYGNIAHALWDGLYPAYLAGVKFGYDNDDFTYVTSEWNNKKTLSYDVVTTFSGNNLQEHSSLERNEITLVETLVSGTGAAGNVIMVSDYVMYGSEFGAIKKFRDRMFKRYGTPQKNRDAANIIIVNNKRYSRDERKVIDRVVSENDSIQFIDWSKHSFSEQLEIIRNTDIHISGPGTGMLYMPFLKDGAVNVNLGYMERSQTNTSRPNIRINGRRSDFVFPGFMEQAVCAGADYVSTIYYDRYKHNSIEYDPLKNVIDEAIEVSKSGIINKNNLNIDAMIFVEYCKRAGNEICEHLTRTSLFIEFFVNEHPLAIPSFVDVDLLRKIKKEFGFDTRYTYVPENKT